MYVNATDLDDPNTLNGQLFYQIAIQLPLVNNVMYFQINNKTGAISLTQEGKSRPAPHESLSGEGLPPSEMHPFFVSSPTLGSQELDPAKNRFYNLVVSVKDMGGQSENSFSDTTSVDITVWENIWKAPEQVEITENSTEPHPIKITQVASRGLRDSKLLTTIHTLWCTDRSSLSSCLTRYILHHVITKKIK